MRRSLMGRHLFSQGFSDSINVLQGNPAQSTSGSFGHLYLSEGSIRPFRGFYTQGTATGSRIMCPLGATWGGMRDYSSVTAQGSLLEDFSKTLYYIGAGEVMKQGIPVDEAALAFTFVPGDVTVATGTVAEVGHGLVTGEPIYLTNTVSDPPAGWSTSTAYFAIVVTVDTFRIATTYKNALAGTQLIPSDAGTGTNSLYWGAGDPLRASTVMQVASNQVATYFYDDIDSAGLGVVDAPQISIPTTPTAAYTGLVNGAVNVKIAAIRDRSTAGNLTTPDVPVKGRASAASAVVVPVNNTIKIQFPAAITGQTHWTVFSTQLGFGGTGAFYRLGYRTTSIQGASGADDWIWGIPEATVSGATDRILEFDYRTGDLLPELAWIEDYPPQVGTHCIRLDTIMVVLGVLDGTVGQVSLPNYFESFNPNHLLYFPEAVTATLSRQIDNYAFVACRNSIHTIQYVGYRGSELPSATITTITPEIGIAYQQNWCQGAGNIAMWIEGTGIAIMGSDGVIDLEFGKEVSYFTKDWVASGVAVSFDPVTRSFVFAYQGQSVSYCIQSGVWSEPIYLTDCGISSSTVWTSGINAQGKLYVSLTASGTSTAYVYDDATSTTRMPVCSVGNWITNQSTARGSGIYEAEASVRVFNTITEPVVIVLHKNLVPTYVRGVLVTSGVARVDTPSNFFVSGATTGSYVAIFGTDIGGAGVHYLVAKATYASATRITLTNPFTGTDVFAQATDTNCFMLFGAYAYALTANQYQQDQHLKSIRPAIQDARSYCASVWMATNALTGAVWQVDIFGTGHDTSNVGTTTVS